MSRAWAPQSIRVRLTVWYAAALTVAMTLYGGGVFVFLLEEPFGGLGRCRTLRNLGGAERFQVDPVAPLRLPLRLRLDQCSRSGRAAPAQERERAAQGGSTTQAAQSQSRLLRNDDIISTGSGTM